ncbi:cuticle protein CP14.6 [Halyomorpha halys]|uniref:cuticle protein CP14.6 n=1 Tax=Halyomorpha halys TaxID=286706 RepID=UPI0006D52889|nr:cuticle protein CP14.6-like [Halyomorpha halys]KAE8574031.1 Cuticle Protein CPR RR-1 [Halyomorpha halys]
MRLSWILLIFGVELVHGQQPPNNDVILSSESENNYNGTYKYRYQTSNGISVEEEGFLKNPGTKEEAQTARGSYSYTAPDGQVITVKWYADETGFHAEGAHIPGSGGTPIQPTAVPRPSDIPRPTIMSELPYLSEPVFDIPAISGVSPEFFRG